MTRLPLAPHFLRATNQEESRSWFGSQHQPIMLKVIMVPQSDVDQSRSPLLASVNACLKLGSGLHLPAVSVLVGSPSTNLNAETLMRLHRFLLLRGLLWFTILSWHNYNRETDVCIIEIDVTRNTCLSHPKSWISLSLIF